jgi:hypothetical protein
VSDATDTQQRADWKRRCAYHWPARPHRLFVIALFRVAVWHRLDPAGRAAIEAAEGFVEGVVTREQLTAAAAAASRAASIYPDSSGEHLFTVTAAFAANGYFPGVPTGEGWSIDPMLAPTVGTNLLSWLEFENEAIATNAGTFWTVLFDEIERRPVPFDHAWRTSTAVVIAQSMYDSRDFSAMPILADALQDAGCDHDDILNHCRDANGTHVRGCWVVDLVLGKA